MSCILLGRGRRVLKVSGKCIMADDETDQLIRVLQFVRVIDEATRQELERRRYSESITSYTKALWEKARTSIE